MRDYGYRQSWIEGGGVDNGPKVENEGEGPGYYQKAGKVEGGGSQEEESGPEEPPLH